MDANKSSMGYVKLNKVWDTFPRDDRVQMGDWEGLPPSLFAFFFFFILWTSSDEADRWPMVRRNGGTDKTRKTRGGNGKAKNEIRQRGRKKARLQGRKRGRTTRTRGRRR